MAPAPVQIQEIKELIVSALKLTDVTPNDIGDDEPLFVEGLGLDSVDGLELVLAVEQRFGMKIEDSKVGAEVLASAKKLTDFVNARLAEPPEKPEAAPGPAQATSQE